MRFDAMEAPVTDSATDLANNAAVEDRRRRTLLQRWLLGVRVLHIGHNLAGEAFDKWARLTGVASAVLASVVGTTIFASLTASTRVEIRIATGVASLLAAGLSTAQLIWSYPQLSQRHKYAAVKYGLLRRTIDRVLSCPVAAESDLEGVSKTWEQIEDNAPPLPERFRHRARRFMQEADGNDASRRPQGHHVPEHPTLGAIPRPTEHS
jgi:hypothetical protein